MTWWKQTALAALAIIVAAVGFARFYPGAPDLLSGLGASPALVSLAVGNGSPENSGKPRQGQGGPGGGGAGGPPRETLVETAEVGFATINNKISAIGDGEAQRSVTLVPLADGIIGEINVKSGDKVKAGDVIARLDSEKEVIARDRAALAVKSLEEKVQRTERLASSRAASEVALSDARSELETAGLALRDAELVLQRRAITAPFDGIVGIVNAEIGQFVTTQTQIATIDDRSSLLIDFWVPERFSAAIVTGQKVEAQPIALPGTVVTGEVAEIASRIEQSSRTLRIRARVANRDDALRPGMSFRVEMRFAGDRFASVDPLAIQWSSDGAYVWRAQDGKAQRVPVKIVQRNSDVVLVDGALAAGEEVVTEGVQTLRDGAALRIAGAPAGPEG